MAEQSSPGHWLAPAWNAVDFLLKIIMAVFLFAMMTITTIDVFGRYVLNAPIPGGFEIVQYLMAMVVFAALPQTTASNSHLSVSLIGSSLRGGPKRIYAAYVQLFSVVGIGIIAWRMIDQGLALSQSQQVSGSLSFPLAPIAWAMSFFAVMAAVISLAMFIRAVMGHNPAINVASQPAGID